MGSTRVFIKPYDDEGQFRDFIEVTKYVQKIGNIKKDVDSLDFQLGVFRNSQLSLSLSNRDGKFSDIAETESIFRYKRADSIVKITWSLNAEVPMAGFVYPNDFFPHYEVTLFEGLLNDDGFKEAAQTEVAEFKVLGFESVFTRAEVPFESLVAGDSISELIYKCLDQVAVRSFLSVNSSDIVPAQNEDSDDIAWFEGKTVKQALDELLKISNSVLDIVDGAVIVRSRTANASIVKRFYGSSSREGVENVIDVKNITNGVNRCWNYFYWTETSLKAKDNPSIVRNLVRKYEVASDIFTDTAKRERLLAALLAEFKDPKKEFELSFRLSLDIESMEIFDKVTVDYPIVFIPTIGFSLPICGVAICGSRDTGPTGAVLPRGLWSLKLKPTDEWKIIAKEIDVVNEIVTIKVRKV